MKPALLIALEDTETNQARPLARVKNPAILVMAAKAALAEKRQEAARLAGQDQFLDTVMDADVQRLEHVLARLIPGLDEDAALAA